MDLLTEPVCAAGEFGGTRHPQKAPLVRLCDVLLLPAHPHRPVLRSRRLLQVIDYGDSRRVVIPLT